VKILLISGNFSNIRICEYPTELDAYSILDIRYSHIGTKRNSCGKIACSAQAIILPFAVEVLRAVSGVWWQKSEDFIDLW